MQAIVEIGGLQPTRRPFPQGKAQGGKVTQAELEAIEPKFDPVAIAILERSGNGEGAKRQNDAIFDAPILGVDRLNYFWSRGLSPDKLAGFARAARPNQLPIAMEGGQSATPLLLFLQSSDRRLQHLRVGARFPSGVDENGSWGLDGRLLGYITKL